MKAKFVGLYGGTFDPIHLGHLTAASDVQQKIGLDEVRMVLSASPPHRSVPTLSAAERFSLLALAVNDFHALVADDCEMARKGPSYMVDTLLDFRQRSPTSSLVLILGMEAFNGLPSWYRWQEIIGLAHIVVTDRAGFDNRFEQEVADYMAPFLTLDKSQLKQQTHGKIYIQPVTAVDISATQIRQRIKAKKTVKHMLTNECLDAISKSGYYT
ncbi:MAG: nicotinate-nucleotide adenylyltransferase [Cycloclasticus sp.]|nr:nicotinate (nicotinamide) nucleotide adenylyltransferase [Cycloclasticus sp. 44_32_T64]